MTREEMARAYADGYNKEYQQIAYDAFLCGYGAKCDTISPDGLEEAAEEYNKQVIEETKCHHNALTYAEGYEDALLLIPEAFIAGAEWMKTKMLEKSYLATISANNTIPVLPMKDVSDIGLDYGDKVSVIVIKEDE